MWFEEQCQPGLLGWPTNPALRLSDSDFGQLCSMFYKEIYKDNLFAGDVKRQTVLVLTGWYKAYQDEQ